MSETPETDEVEDMHDDLDVCLAAMTGLARRLEEERDQTYRYLHLANGTAELALKHRDEAESLLREIGKTWVNNDDLTEVMKRVDDYLNGPFSENGQSTGTDHE